MQALDTRKKTIRPFDAIINALEAHGCQPKKTGPDRYKALCPMHDDHKPSLSIRELADGKVLLKCFAGCTSESIVSAGEVEVER